MTDYGDESDMDNLESRIEAEQYLADAAAADTHSSDVEPQ